MPIGHDELTGPFVSVVHTQPLLIASAIEESSEGSSSMESICPTCNHVHRALYILNFGSSRFPVCIPEWVGFGHGKQVFGLAFATRGYV
jgi:hypothetical protein